MLWMSCCRAGIRIDASRFMGLVMLLVACLPSSGQIALDLDGHAVEPLRVNAGKVTVLVFVRRDCPISGRYAPEIQRISAEHKTDAKFYLVFPDRSESAENIRKYLSDFRYPISAVRDPEHALVKLSHAQVTPEAAVFNTRGVLIYHGRIDNLYESIGRSRSSATSHELENAIADALAGHAPVVRDRQAVGCFISDLE